VSQRERRCARCKNIITEDNRSRQKSYCCECLKQRQREYYQRHKDKIRVKEREKARQRRRQNPAAHRAKVLKERFGITPQDYESLLSQQGGVCAICEAHEPGGCWNTYFHIDHNTTTGVVRGLLCQHCNCALGIFRHSPQLLAKALSYLCRADNLDPTLTELHWVKTK
jgi:hypothetical protein